VKKKTVKNTIAHMCCGLNWTRQVTLKGQVTSNYDIQTTTQKEDRLLKYDKARDGEISRCPLVKVMTIYPRQKCSEINC